MKIVARQDDQSMYLRMHKYLLMLIWGLLLGISGLVTIVRFIAAIVLGYPASFFILFMGFGLAPFTIYRLVIGEPITFLGGIMFMLVAVAVVIIVDIALSGLVKIINTQIEKRYDWDTWENVGPTGLIIICVSAVARTYARVFKVLDHQSEKLMEYVNKDL